MDEIVAHYSEAVEGSPVTYTYTNSEARALLQETGFEIIEMVPAPVPLPAWRALRVCHRHL